MRRRGRGEWKKSRRVSPRFRRAADPRRGSPESPAPARGCGGMLSFRPRQNRGQGCPRTPARARAPPWVSLEGRYSEEWKSWFFLRFWESGQDLISGAKPRQEDLGDGLALERGNGLGKEGFLNGHQTALHPFNR